MQKCTELDVMIKLVKPITTKNITPCYEYTFMSMQAETYHGKNALIMNAKGTSSPRYVIISSYNQQKKNIKQKITTCVEITNA